MRIRDISDMVELADGDNPYRYTWGPCERCAGRLTIQQAVYFEDILLRCEDCGEQYRVEDRG